MTVHVLIPVFNRLALTQRVIDCLRVQRVDEPLNIIIIDDGSTDGTAEFLASQDDITVLTGDGSLWWAGAIEKGLQFVLESGQSSDWVLLVNNDTEFASDFVHQLLLISRNHAPAAVGSVVCDLEKPDELLSIGPMINTWRLQVTDKLTSKRNLNVANEPHLVHALSGRGTLYPLLAFRIAGTMRTTWLPHYLADYELAVRAHQSGFKLLVCESAITLSLREFGNSKKYKNKIHALYSRGSLYYLPAILYFWWRLSNKIEKIFLIPKVFLIFIIKLVK